ncbi:MAG: accessory gene regulator B family protein [Oscillospiraceae bacterium]|nr:accessory gene regulator B family protein [Oscillospiraceae bacterium]
MIDLLGSKISSKFVEHKIITEDMVDIYKYGVEITISSIIGFALVLIIGLIFKSLMQALIFYIVFIILRSFTGGYHASSYLKCNLVFSITASLVIFFSKAATEVQFSTGVINSLFLPALSVFLWLAPIENPNKPIEKKRRIYFKTGSVLAAVILYIFSLVLYIYNHTFESAIIVTTMFITALMCMITKFQKGEN